MCTMKGLTDCFHQITVRYLDELVNTDFRLADRNKGVLPMTEPIRVLQILGIVAGGGVEAVILNYYDHIDRSKVQFDFIVHNDNKIDITDRVEAMGGHVYKVTPYYRNPIAFMWDIYKVIKEHHYRIVHSNMNTLSAFTLFAAWAAGAPIRILHNHSTSSPGETKRNIMKYILRPFARLFANQYFACSRLAGEWMYGKKMMDKGKVTIINNAIDLNKYAFNPSTRKRLRNELGLTDEQVIGHVGRFMFQKNHEFLIDLFSKALQKNNHMVLLLIGDGPLRPAIQSKVDQMGLSDKVRFLGLRSDVQDLYNVMDIFVLPSHYEGLPVVGVEAQANGLPCLFSSNVTTETKLTHCAEFYDLSEGSEKWAKKILSMDTGRNKNVKDEMKEAGFEIDDAAEKLKRLYGEISTLE